MLNLSLIYDDMKLNETAGVFFSSFLIHVTICHIGNFAHLILLGEFHQHDVTNIRRPILGFPQQDVLKYKHVGIDENLNFKLSICVGDIRMH